ncbi:hypothetical protein GF376_00595 [Candidatus Peregrinibacteria bacterium]|nr:hypothetical protein [Candidatus Peregrinibacteria bacterium]
MKTILLDYKNIIIGHRGCRERNNPGNTLECFEKALYEGADVLELDVRTTRDRIPIVFHDSEIEGQRIKSLSYDQIREIGEANGLRIPTLQQFLIYFEEKTKLLIELKERGNAREIIALALKYFTSQELFVQSFDDETVKKMKTSFPNLKVGLLIGIGRDNVFGLKGLKFWLWKLTELFPMSRIKRTGADFISVNYALLWFGMIEKLQKYKIPLLVWTVNQKKQLIKLMKSKQINGIITDRTAVALKVRNNLKNKT